MALCAALALAFVSAASEARGEADSALFAYDDYYAVALPADDTVWVVGGWGRALRSGDGGETWELRSVLDEPRALLDASFGDARRGWIVGEGGLALRTEDGGLSWYRQKTPTEYNLLAVEAVDAERAWAVGDRGVIVRTRDGGRTWLDESLDRDAILNDVAFTDDQRGWIVGEFGTVLRTRDGGSSWEEDVEIKGAPEDVYLFGAVFEGELGFATGLAGTLLRSQDGGRAWQALTSGTLHHLFSVALAGGESLAVGDQASILRMDSGGSPAPVATPNSLSGWLRAVAFRGATGFAVGSKGQVLRSRDAGASWQDVSPLGRIAATDAGEPEP
ncbi:MAG: hypothetical protein J4G09_01865 [Proteobacteria bacterium]|nr:hypothetical protein [Pseudomonadota bacterium]